MSSDVAEAISCLCACCNYFCIFLQRCCWIWERRDQSWDGWRRHMRTEWVFIPQQAFLRLQVHESKLPFAARDNKLIRFPSRIWILLHNNNRGLSRCLLIQATKKAFWERWNEWQLDEVWLSLAGPVLSYPFIKNLWTQLKCQGSTYV